MIHGVMKMRHSVIHAVLSVMVLTAGDRVQSAARHVRIGIEDAWLQERTVLEGNPARLFKLVLAEAARAEGWELEFKAIPPGHSLQALRSREVDLLAPAVLDTDHKPDILFNRQQVLSTWMRIFAHKHDEIQNVTDLDNRWIGIRRDDPHVRELKQDLSRYNLHCKFIEFNTYAEGLEALSRQWIDAMAVDRLFPVAGRFRRFVSLTPIQLSPVELRFCASVKLDPAVLAMLDFHLHSLKQDPNSPYYEGIRYLEEAALGAAPSDFLRWALWITGGLTASLGGIILYLRGRIHSHARALRLNSLQLQQEILSHKRTTDSLSQSEALLRLTFTHMQDGLLIFNAESRRLLAGNDAARNLLGIPQDRLEDFALESLYWNAKEAQRFEESLARLASGITHHRTDLHLKRRDGSRIPVEIIVSQFFQEGRHHPFWVMSLRDNSMREALRESEIRLRQAQKMEAIGTLAGGIAHDFNNLLTPILGYTELILQTTNALDENTRFSLKQIGQAGMRARSLVQQILSFSRKTDLEKRSLKIGQAVQEAMKLLRPSIPSSIDIRLFQETEQDAIIADPTQVHQVLMNLCANASQAIGGRRGTIEIRAFRHQGSSPGLTWGNVRGDEAYVGIEILDTGPGIPADIVHLIFDPFFTTKKQGEGTGMGLSVVLGILEAHSGYVAVQTIAGEGAAFSVFFPAAVSSTQAQTQPEPDAGQGGGRHILFVDDESVITDMSCRILRRAGFHPTCFQDSRQAFERFQTAPDRYDLLITDQAMPHLTGLELARLILRIRPDMPVIMTSGHSTQETIEEAEALGIHHYLKKPFTPQELIGSIRKVLKPPPGGVPDPVISKEGFSAPKPDIAFRDSA